ncbi:hypothetical protein DIPPA_35871 [Diplonema papillatum]|nr:hypothetical protein DIPPA_35871 [Diplonema papillatum]
MVSQKNKKQSHVAKLKAALQAPVEDLEKVMKPFTSMVSTEQQKDVVKDERLLKAWVARMQEELDAGKLDAVAALVKPCAMQVYRSFEDEVKVVKSSGLVGFLVAAIQKLAIEGPKQSHTLTSVLDIAETINEELQLRSELFLNVAEQLITLGTDPAQTIDNRRTCLSMIKSGVYGSDDHRNHFTTEMLATLAKYCTEADDFFCQANIVGTMGKLLLKKKETAVKAMTDVWGAKWCNRLRDLIQEDPGSSQNFVLEFNAADLNPNVKSIGCHELMIGAFKLAAGEPSQFLVHFSPAAICFSLPVPDSDGEVDIADIPLTGINELNRKNSFVTIVFKAASLPELLQPFTDKSTLTLVLKANDVKSWATSLTTMIQRVTGRVSKSANSGKRKSRGPSEADEKLPTPPSKKKAVEKDASQPLAQLDANSEPVFSRAKKQAKQSKTAAPRLSIDHQKKGSLEDPSPFAKSFRIEAEEEDANEGDLDVVFSQLRHQFASNAMKKQQRGREGLEKTMDLVQNLVDDYKNDSVKRDSRLEENVRVLQRETEKAEHDFAACFTREKELTKDIEDLHKQFNAKALEHRDNMIAFQEELEQVLPRVREHETKALHKLKEMVDTEIVKLEEQVSKIQSQKSMMTRMMKFMMAQLSTAEE